MIESFTVSRESGVGIVEPSSRGRSSPAPADHPVFIDVLPPPDASNVRSVSAVVPVAGRKLGLFLVRGERMEL